MRRAILCAIAITVIGVVVTDAQAPDFSGTWKLDQTRSRVAAGAGLAGLIGAGVPEVLHVTQPANGTLIIESQINEGHSRIYMPGVKTSTPVFLGTLGSITMTSKWDGRTLVSEGHREDSAAGTSTPVKEVVSLSADGRTLSLEVTTTGSAGTSTSTLMYTRTQDVGPCKSWPTPCKTPAP